MKKQLLSLALLTAPVLSNAATTWIGPATMNATVYAIGTNWSAGVPSASEAITFTNTVAIIGTIPTTSGNDIVLTGNAALTINLGVSVTLGNISVVGTAGRLTNNGTITANNLTYGNTAGGSMTNSGTMTINKINVGNSAITGTFTNNGTLTVATNITVEEGTFDNNPLATVNSKGLDIQNGGSMINGGTMTSTGTTASAQLSVSSGGKFNNEGTGSLTVDISIGNTYAIDLTDSFSNAGTVNVGHNPYNPNSKGVIVRTTGDFYNRGVMRFQIDPANCVITDNHASGGSFSSLQPVVISGTNTCASYITVLPVELEAFSAAVNNNNADLNWKAGTEKDLLVYEVQESTDGKNFSTVTTVSAAGSGMSYNASVNMPEATVVYYRLNMIDVDGTNSYSSVVSLKKSNIGNDADVMLYPTVIGQGADRFNLTYTATTPAEMKVTVISLNGAVVMQQSVSANIGKNVFSIAPGALPQGHYFVRLAGNDFQSATQRMIVQ